MIRLSTLLIVAAFIAALCWTMDRTAWPSPRMDIQWHQHCVYAVLPDGTVNAFPGNLCDRDTWKL